MGKQLSEAIFPKLIKFSSQATLGPLTFSLTSIVLGRHFCVRQMTVNFKKRDGGVIQQTTNGF